MSIVSGKSSKGLPQAPDSEAVSRRVVVRRVGNWLIYVGGLSAVAACGRTPLGDPFGVGGDDDDISSNPTPSPSPTPSIPPCGECEVPSGAPTGLNRSDLPVNSVAFNIGLSLFVCHDAAGYYAMSALCSHAGCNIGAQGNFTTGNVGAGFACDCHGSQFDGNGEVTVGPALSPLLHYRLSTDGTGAIFVDQTPPFPDVDCRCP